MNVNEQLYCSDTADYAGKSLEVLRNRQVTPAEEKLLILAKRGDQSAFEELVRGYRWMIRRRARGFFLQGGDYEDLIQEAMLGFFKAVRDYRSESGSFRAFAEICVVRQVITAVKTASRLKHLPLNSAHSLDAPRYQDGDRQVVDGLGDPRAVFEPNLLLSEDVRRIMGILKRRLSTFEYSALVLWLEGRSYEEIARQLERQEKSVDNGLWRVKSKLRRLLASGALVDGRVLD